MSGKRSRKRATPQKPPVAQTPDSLPGLLSELVGMVRTGGKVTRVLSILFCLVVGAGIVIFLVWKTFPDQIKTGILSPWLPDTATRSDSALGAADSRGTRPAQGTAASPGTSRAKPAPPQDNDAAHDATGPHKPASPVAQHTGGQGDSTPNNAHGYVRTSTGTAIESVQVVLIWNGPPRVTTTDSNGYFTLAAPAMAQGLSVQLSKPGFRSTHLPVDLRLTGQTFLLEPSQ